MLRQKHYQTEEESQQGTIFTIDSEMQGLISKLNKKGDKTLSTRIKAFREILEKIKQKPAEYMESFMKIYLMIFDFVTFAEKDKDILMANQGIFEQIVTINPKAVKKNFKQIFPLLYFSCFHHIEEVGLRANQNMNLLIKSDENLAKAFAFYHNEFFEKATPFMDQGPEYMKDISIYQSDDTDKIIFNNNRTTMLRAIAHTVKILPHSDEKTREEMMSRISSFLGMPNKNKKKNLKVLQFFQDFPHDYLLKTAVTQIFNQYLQSGFLSFLAQDLQKIVNFFLIENIDDATYSV